MATSTARHNSRRGRHQKKSSLSAYNEEYDKRNVRYSASPTPGNSASKHHRRNSSKLKKFDLASFNQKNMNIKFANKEMNEINAKPTPISIKVTSKKYKITSSQTTTEKETEKTDTKASNCKTDEFYKEWALRLTIKENEINAIKSKNLSFIQSLQKQIHSLTKQLNKERNKNQKHTLTAQDLADLDLIKRENSKLRATIRRMKDELKYLEMHRNGPRDNAKYKAEATGDDKAERKEINNYYINTINYNHITNNNSRMNLQNNNNNNNLKWYPLSLQEPQPPQQFKREESNCSTWTMQRYQSYQSAQSSGDNTDNDDSNVVVLSLHEMEKKYIKKKQLLDVREKQLNKHWEGYRQQKETFDFERDSLEIGKRELHRNNRRLKMKLHQLEILKYENILFKTPKLLQIKHGNNVKFMSDFHIETGKFSGIKLNAIKHSITNGYKLRKQKIDDLYQQYTQLKARLYENEIPEIKKWIKTQNKNNKKYTKQIVETINKYIENKKENSALIRRFDTKQFDPIRFKKQLFVDSEEEEAVEVLEEVKRGHRTQFSFERNTSFDIPSDDGDNDEVDGNDNDITLHLNDSEALPPFYRKRTKSRKLDEDEFTLLSPNTNKLDIDTDEEEQQQQQHEEEDMDAVPAENVNIGDIDLLRLIKLNQSQTDALRMKLTELKCNNFNLKSKYEYLKYDKQLLLDQIEELNEVNAELKHNCVEMTENMRDDGILRQELVNKESEIANNMVKYDELLGRYNVLKKDYNSMSKMYQTMKNRKLALIDDVNKYKQLFCDYFIEYLWSEYVLINNVTNMLNDVENIQKYDHNSLKTSLQKTIHINNIHYAAEKNKNQYTNGDIYDMAFDSKSKLNEFITDLDILPAFTQNDNANDGYYRISLPPMLKKLEFIFVKLLSKIDTNNVSFSQLDKINSTSNECDECTALSLKLCELNNNLFSIESEKEDIYLLFSKYKKERLNLLKKINEYKNLDSEYRQIVQQLSQTQNELECEQEAFKLFKATTQRKLSKMSDLEKQHRKLSSASIAKQRLDLLLGEVRLLNLAQHSNNNNKSEDEEEPTPDTTNNDEDSADSHDNDELVYDNDFDFNEKTMVIGNEHFAQQHSRCSSMVINDDIDQDSKIHKINLSKDILPTLKTASSDAMSEKYGYNVGELSPIVGAQNEATPNLTISDNTATQKYWTDTSGSNLSNISTNAYDADMPDIDNYPIQNNTKSRREQKINKHLPHDSFLTLSPAVKQQIIDKKKPKNDMNTILEHGNANKPLPPRRNTIDRLIEQQELQLEEEEIKMISEQETQLLAPGNSPLSIHMEKKKKLDQTYQDILAQNATNYNESMDFNQQSYDMDEEDEYKNIYADFGDNDSEKGQHWPSPSHIKSQSCMNRYNEMVIGHEANKSSLSSVASDGYLELSDTMKISREQFQELREKHNKQFMQNPLLSNMLNEIEETQAAKVEIVGSTDKRREYKEIRKKNQSFDVVEAETEKKEESTAPKKEHKRNQTTLVHLESKLIDSGNEEVLDTAVLSGVRRSENLEDMVVDDDDKRMDQPRFGVVHKQSKSIVSDNGTHYISYQQQEELLRKQLSVESGGNIVNVEQQRIDDIIGSNIDISAIAALQSN